MKVCIVGLGYVGLPAACVLAQAGHTVVGVDVRADVVAGLNKGRVHIDEPGIADLLREALEQESFTAHAQPEPADAFILCVPTPFQDGYQPDLSYVEAAARSALPVLKDGDLVVVESTIPVGATAKVAALIRTARPELTPDTLHVAHFPERVLPGKAIRQIIYNDRVVGDTTPEATERAARLYRSFSRCTVAETTASTAELAKLAENTFRDINIVAAAAMKVPGNSLYSKLYLACSQSIQIANENIKRQSTSLTYNWASATRASPSPTHPLSYCSKIHSIAQIFGKTTHRSSNWILASIRSLAVKQGVAKYA